MENAVSIDSRIASELVQSQLPDLTSERSDNTFANYNNKRPLCYPRGEQQVIESLVTIAHCLTKHEKHADIWKRQVSSPILSQNLR
jgi:hypothetical protein